VLILHTEDRPHGSAANLDQSDNEGCPTSERRVSWEVNIEDPGKAKRWICNQGCIVDPTSLESKNVPEKSVLGKRVEKTPIHTDIPYQGVHCADGSTRDEETTCLPIDLIDA
jgi:hypothetical protein